MNLPRQSQSEQFLLFLSFQKLVDAAQVFAHPATAELVHLGYKSVQEVTVVADNY